MNIFSSLKHTFSNTFNYKGRASKYEFFYYTVLYTIVSVFLPFVLIFVFSLYEDIYKYIIASISVLLLIPYLSLFLRRLHDIGNGFPTFLIIFIILFFLLPIFVLILCIKPGDKKNKYGDIPVETFPKYENIYEYLSDGDNNKTVSLSLLESIRYGLTYGYLDVSGRASRKEFFSIQLFIFLIYLFLFSLDYTAYSINLDLFSYYTYSYTLDIADIFLIFLGFPIITSITRRLHDLNAGAVVPIILIGVGLSITLIFVPVSILIVALNIYNEMFNTLSPDYYPELMPYSNFSIPYISLLMLSLVIMPFKGSVGKNRFGHSLISYNATRNNNN